MSKNCDIETPVWETLRINLVAQLDIEKRKYPLTEREQMLADVILEILKNLESCK